MLSRTWRVNLQDLAKTLDLENLNILARDNSKENRSLSIRGSSKECDVRSSFSQMGTLHFVDFYEAPSALRRLRAS